MTSNFFDQLEEFLPKHVSPLPSYVHASAAFIIAALITYYFGAKHIVFDFNKDEHISDTEKSVEQYVQLAVCTVVSLLVADLVFSSSFKLRSYKTNKKHYTYRRWFPGVY